MKPGPVVITESPSHFLLRVHPEDGDRARGIPGRRWDGERQAWVFQKTIECYSALKAEFEGDADVFALRRPLATEGLSRSVEFKAIPEEEDEVSVESFEGDQRVGPGITAATQEMINSIRDGFADQNRTLQDILSKQESISERVAELELVPKAVSKEIRTVKELPDLLDLNKAADLELFERALITQAYFATLQEQSFMNWVAAQKPLRLTTEFVQNTHEQLRGKLEFITGIHDPQCSFWNLLKIAERENLIYFEEHDPVKVLPILYGMNAIRNQFGHPRTPLGEADRRVRSIIYLMNLALIWTKIMVEEEVTGQPTSEKETTNQKYKP